jgi:2-oxoisovalerate dehydrogenase E1 component alpha subunit
MDYVRVERRPFLLEVMVSRLYGHSSASGANFVPEEVDCLVPFEKKLDERRIMSRDQMDELKATYTQQLLEASKHVREEPQPKGEDIYRHVFAERDRVAEGKVDGGGERRDSVRPLGDGVQGGRIPRGGSRNGVH